MYKEQTLNFLKNNRTLNRTKVNMKSMLNINCIKNKQKNSAKKVKNFPLDKFISIKNISFKKVNDINKKEKSKENKKTFEKNRNFSYIPNMNRNNCTINNNINYSNNNNINFNMINNNININNNKILTKQNTKYDFNKNKIRKKMILSEINTNLYNTNLTSLNTEISKITGNQNITSYFDINNKNILLDKKNKNNSNKNMIKNNERNLTGNNSYHHEHHKKSDDSKNKTKIIFINCQNLRRNNRLQNNSHTQTQNNLVYKPKQNRQLPIRKFNNSQKNIIMNNMKKTFYTTYLYNSKNDLEKKFKFNSNNSTINKTGQNKKYFHLSKENSILNLTGSFNSQKHIFTENMNIIFDNDNDININKIMRKNKSSFIENKKLINTADIHLKSVKDLISNKFIQELNIIQIDFDKNLNLNKNNNSKIKKYKIIKNSFDTFLKLLNQTLFRNTFNTLIKYLEKIYLAYDEIFTGFSAETQKFKKINNNLKDQKDKIENKYNDLQTLLAEKQEKLKDIEQKFLTLLNMINKSGTDLKDYSISLNRDFTLKAKSIEEGEIIKTIDEIDKEKDGKIFEMNKNNLDDLDALYFFDKIKMAPQRSSSEIKIPILNMTKKHKNFKKRENAPIGKHKIDIINISDIKFTSNYFNKFKQAFEKDE